MRRSPSAPDRRRAVVAGRAGVASAHSPPGPGLGLDLTPGPGEGDHTTSAVTDTRGTGGHPPRRERWRLRSGTTRGADSGRSRPGANERGKVVTDSSRSTVMARAQCRRYDRPLHGQMRPSCRLRGCVSDHLPGRAGLRPPRASMAKPIRAVGLWNPKAIRVMTLILVFTDSMRPLLRPCSRVAWMLGR